MRLRECIPVVIGASLLTVETDIILYSFTPLSLKSLIFATIFLYLGAVALGYAAIEGIKEIWKYRPTIIPKTRQVRVSCTDETAIDTRHVEKIIRITEKMKRSKKSVILGKAYQMCLEDLGLYQDGKGPRGI